ncbi:serine/threonine-protein kinase PknB-like isoform X2 [Paramacrobiotus metropolitanus]|nr:serine/threonine-protein kinase PknB-like isoform X2 [Paramacrobiotus metropolitanus]
MRYSYSQAEFIGKGAFGVIHKARVVKRAGFTGADAIAVKVIRIAANSGVMTSEESWKKVVSRLRKLRGLLHKHLVLYHKVTITRASGGATVELAMDVYDCDLASFLREAKKKNVLSDEKVIRFAKNITKGLHFLHQNNIIHGDLKPENILMRIFPNNRERLLIGDLDDLVQMQESVTCSGDISQLRGTIRYMSPEMLKKFAQMKTEDPGRKTDIWSLGCMILEMAECCQRLDQRRLVNERKIIEVGDDIPNHRYANLIMDGYAPFVSDVIVEDLARLIGHCLQRRSTNRISAEALLRKLWKYQGLVFFYTGRIQEECGIPLVVFDPSTGSLHTRTLPCPSSTTDSKLLKGYYSSYCIAATETEVIVATRIIPDWASHSESHFQRVDEETGRVLRPLPDSPVCTSAVAIEDKLYFWDLGHERFVAKDVTTGSDVSLETPGKGFSSAQIVGIFGKRILYATHDELYSYDTVNNNWAFVWKWPINRRWSYAATVVNGCIYVLGGNMPQLLPDNHGRPTATCFRLQIETATREELEALKRPRYDHVARVIKNRIYICGGRHSAYEYAATIEFYDMKHKAGWSVVSLSASDQQLLPWISGSACERLGNCWNVAAMYVNIDSDGSTEQDSVSTSIVRQQLLPCVSGHVRERLEEDRNMAAMYVSIDCDVSVEKDSISTDQQLHCVSGPGCERVGEDRNVAAVYVNIPRLRRFC